MDGFKNVLVLDVETTGLNPSKHACIELGAVLLDEHFRIVREFSSLVAPWRGAEFVEASMRVNQIPIDELRDAPEPTQVVRGFHETFQLDGAVPLLGGWNVWFDVSFLRRLYEDARRPWPFSYRLLDVQSVVSFHLHLAALSQENVVERFLKDKQAHRALPDARHTASLLQELAKRFLRVPSNDTQHHHEPR